VSISFTGELWHNGTGDRLMSFGYTVDPTATNFILTSESISNASLVPSLAFSFPTAQVVTPVDGTQPSNQLSLAVSSLPLSAPWQPGAALWLIWSIDFYGSGSGNGYAIDNLSFSASVSAGATRPLLTDVSYSDAGLSFSFTNTPGTHFTVYANSDLLLGSWTAIGNPTETPQGSYSIYSFTDAGATGIGRRFYKVSSP